MEKVIDKKTTYKGKVVSVEEVEIDFNNGNVSTFERVKFNVETGVSALPMDKSGNIILIKHFQLGVGKRIITLPTGGLEKGEDPKKRMAMELQEEIGFYPNKLTLLMRAHAIPGYVGTEPFYIYLAEDLVPSKTKGDELEDIEVIKIPYDKVVEMIKNGEIEDSRIIMAVLFHQKFF
ncbi:NUDIX hydrolase [Patescibacteria group bacterium]